MGLGKFLRPAVDTGHIVKAQVIAHPLQEGNPLLQGVQQGEADGGLQNPQRQAGKARAGAHVGHRLVPEVRQSQQGGAVEKMERGHFLRVCDGGTPSVGSPRVSRPRQSNCFIMPSPSEDPEFP